jgi:hypothetical protein
VTGASSLPGLFLSLPCCEYSILIVLKTIFTFCVTPPSSLTVWASFVMKPSSNVIFKQGMGSAAPVPLHISRWIVGNDARPFLGAVAPLRTAA